jgi:hypothetical protein
MAISFPRTGELAPEPPIDLRPQTLADALDAVYRAIHESDREVAMILKTAREGLRALAWNRYAQAQTRASRAYRLRRRHQGHQEGQDHA